MFVLLYGRKGLFAPLIAKMGFPIVFAFPGACGSMTRVCASCLLACVWRHGACGHSAAVLWVAPRRPAHEHCLPAPLPPALPWPPQAWHWPPCLSRCPLCAASCCPSWSKWTWLRRRRRGESRAGPAVRCRWARPRSCCCAVLCCCGRPPAASSAPLPLRLRPSRRRRSLGASDLQVFWNVTLPNIRWGLLYGIILTNAVSGCAWRGGRTCKDAQRTRPGTLAFPPHPLPHPLPQPCLPPSPPAARDGRVWRGERDQRQHHRADADPHAVCGVGVQGG